MNKKYSLYNIVIFLLRKYDIHVSKSRTGNWYCFHFYIDVRKRKSTSLIEQVEPLVERHFPRLFHSLFQIKRNLFVFQILGNSKSKYKFYFWYSVYSTVLHLEFMTRTSRVAVIMQFTLAASTTTTCIKGRSPFNGRLPDFFLLSILIDKYLFTGSLKKIDQLIFRNAKEIYFNEKFPIL